MSTTDDWRGRLGRQWAEGAERQDRFLAPFGEAALEALGDVAGLRALDLGCGAGAVTLELARRGAEAVGLDVSPDLVAAARRRAEGVRGVRFVEADAAEAPPPGPFDALVSRFGAMFFDDPVPAWRGLRGVMRPGGRLSVACWRSLKENDWAGLPLRLCEGLTEAPPRLARGAPGPFGWADPDFFAAALEGAGWEEVRWRSVDAALPVGAGDDPVGAAVEMAMGTGPLAARLREADEATREEAARRLRAGFAEHLRDGEVRLRGAVWIVSARA